MVLEIFKILLPSVVVFFTAYFSIRLLTKNESEKKFLEIKSKTQKDVLMLRLQAYERLVLLLERISPYNLVIRSTSPDLSINETHRKLLMDIRAEFDHNISQQLYISADGWKIIKETKEEIVKIINVAKENLPVDSRLMDFTKAIVENDLKNNSPSVKAIEFLKHEAHSLF